MQREIILNGRKIEYEFQSKKVKNINLRINSDGIIRVSANRWTKMSAVEGFLESKAELILKAMDKYKEITKKPKIQYFTEEGIKYEILMLCEKIYPCFEKRGVKYPEIKFRSMVSRWGSCHTIKGVLTFNTKLMYAPRECIEYVIYHEFTHFLQANHSPAFYRELEMVCSDWKEARKKLKEIDIR